MFAKCTGKHGWNSFFRQNCKFLSATLPKKENKIQNMTTGQGSYIGNLRLLVNPFQPSVAFDMETSQLICTANGFEMG